VAKVLLFMAVLLNHPLLVLTIVPALQSVTRSYQKSQTFTENSAAICPKPESHLTLK